MSARLIDMGYLLAGLVACLTASTAVAGNIEGAFGQKLGQTFSGALQAASSLTDGTPMYSFKPAKPFRAFSEYYVTITPKSRRVTRIWAVGDQESDPKCDAERSVLKSILEKKYGGTFQKPLMSNDEMLAVGKRQIALKCEGFVPPIRIQVIYRDSDLTAVAERERVDSEAAKIDAGGL